MFADGFRTLSSSTALLVANGDALCADWEIPALTYSDSQLTRKDYCTSFLNNSSTVSQCFNCDLTDCG